MEGLLLKLLKRNKNLSVDKANVLEVSVLWKVISELSEEYPDVELSHMLVDNAAIGERPKTI